MCTSLRGVLTIDEAIEVLPNLVCVGDNDFYVLVLEMNDGIECFVRHVLGKQVC